jgi:hypothetical protein
MLPIVSAAYQWLGANCDDVKPFEPRKIFKRALSTQWREALQQIEQVRHL